MNLLLSCRKKKNQKKEENCFAHLELQTGEQTRSTVLKGNGQKGYWKGKYGGQMYADEGRNWHKCTPCLLLKTSSTTTRQMLANNTKPSRGCG